MRQTETLKGMIFKQYVGAKKENQYSCHKGPVAICFGFRARRACTRTHSRALGGWNNTSVARLGSGSRMSKREKISIPFFLLPSLAIIQASHPPGSLTNAFQIVPTYFLLFLSPPGRDKGITQSLRISGPWLHSDILSSDNLVIFRLLAIFETTTHCYVLELRWRLWDFWIFQKFTKMVLTCNLNLYWMYFVQK